LDKGYTFQTEKPLTTDLVSTAFSTQLNFDPKYKLIQSFKYDDYGNIVEVSKSNDITTAYIWDFDFELPVAEAINTTASDISYCGFETSSSGGWSGIILANTTNADARAGTKSYNLSSIISKALTSGKKYLVSYWSKNGMLTITGTTSTSTGIPINGWIYYVHEVAGVSSVSITGSKTIDELRLWPIESVISTYTYDFGSGISSSQDVSGRINYFYFDALGRLKTIRDSEKSIITDYQFRFKNY
jgi:hypothetical protein